MLPLSGAVAGIDVGYSATRKSSAVCLVWDEHSIDWRIERYRAIDKERSAVIKEVIGDRELLAVALDGPLRTTFDAILIYRAAERMLTRALRKKIGKPGQCSAPVGKRLNAEANRCAMMLCHDFNIAMAHIRLESMRVVSLKPFRPHSSA